jgi:hypothetical protein
MLSRGRRIAAAEGQASGEDKRQKQNGKSKTHGKHPPTRAIKNAAEVYRLPAPPRFDWHSRKAEPR